MSVQFCKTCFYPSSSAAPLTFDDQGRCSGCRVAGQTVDIDWDERWTMLEEMVDEYRNPSGYDCVIPVGGGKDSYYQTHLAVKKLGLRPLLVTYHGNNFLPEGEYNLQLMREAFDTEHIIMRPGLETLIKMNLLGFKLHGDMNWHNHAGIKTYPIQMAVRHEIPLMLWGDHGWVDLGGMFSYSDFPEFTAKTRKEHDLHGLDWDDFTDEGLERHGRPDLKMGLTKKELSWAVYPSDEEIDRVGVRGVYLGFYEKWNGNKCAAVAEEEYGWKKAEYPFERTYRKISNLDDMHENGVHDYLKFIKFGYGRATDHASQDVRLGVMDYKTGLEMVRKHDHVKPRRDLERWLGYVDMSEAEFDRICDTFRDPRVWRIENDQWVKDDVWGGASSYGPVYLDKDDPRRELYIVKGAQV